jgi:hypothetical protein
MTGPVAAVRILERGGTAAIVVHDREGKAAMSSDDDQSVPSGIPPAAAPATVPVPDRFAADRQRRHAARRFFREAPPYCIEFDKDGSAMLCRKCYEYWPDRAPEEATTWRMISRHETLEEAERRLRQICGGPIYYDAEGRLMNKAPPRRSGWEMPPTDDD